MWQNRKWFNLHIVGIPEIKYRKSRAEEMFEEMMAKNFSKLIDPRSSTVIRIKNNNNNKATSRHIMIKLLKTNSKEKL